MSNPPIHSLDLNPLYINVHLTGFGPQGVQGPPGDAGPAGDPGVGRRTIRVVVGSVAGGYTEDDCDFLCDGEDDQIQINAAIDSLPFNKPDEEIAFAGYIGGGEVLLLDGEYNLTAPIVISDKPGTVLRGSGPSTVLVRRWESQDDYEGVIQIVPGDYGNSWCRISDMLINGNGLYGLMPETEPTGDEFVSPYNCCIVGKGLYENIIEDVCCSNSPVGIYLCESSCHITRCWIGFCGMYGLHVEKDSGVAGVTIKDCQILGGDMMLNDPPESVGIYADNSTNMTIESTMIYGGASGIEVNECPMMSMLNNVVICGGTAIYVEGSFSIFTRIVNNFLIGNFVTQDPEPVDSTVVLGGSFTQMLDNYVVAGQCYAGLCISSGAAVVANNVIWTMYSDVGMYLEDIMMSKIMSNIIIPMASGEITADTASIKCLNGMAVQLNDNTCAYGGIHGDKMMMGGIKGNVCLGGELGAGIDLDSCFMVTIDSNNCQNKEYGLRMCSTLFLGEDEEPIHSQLNNVSGNVFCNNTVAELYLEDCDDNLINGNVCKGLPFAYFGEDHEPAEYSILLAGIKNNRNFVTGNHCDMPPNDQGGIDNLIINNFPHQGGEGSPDYPLSTVAWRGLVENGTPAAWTELFINGEADHRLELKNQSICGFSLHCTALSFTDYEDNAKRWKLEGLMMSDLSNDVVLVGSVTKTVIAQTDSSGGTDDWDVRVVADKVNQALKIEVLGEAGMDIHYVVRGEIETAWDEIPV